MRLHSVLSVVFTTLFAIVNAQSAFKQTNQELITSDSMFESCTITSENDVVPTRLLRTNEDANEGKNTVERRLVNVDLAIKDAVHEVRKVIKWKVQFAVWKAMKKEPFELAQKWGIASNGRAMRQQEKWEKLQAYQKFWDKGPLKYPKQQQNLAITSK